MGWSTSNISTAALTAIMNGNAATSQGPGPFFGSTQSFSGDTVNVALYGNTGTPDGTDTLAHNAYNGSGGAWVVANEVSGTGYTAAGKQVTPVTESHSTTNVATFTSSGTPNWTAASFTAFGGLVYDNTVTNKYAYCWNYFGGSQVVTSGTFTINWNASGIFAITCT